MRYSHESPTAFSRRFHSFFRLLFIFSLYLSLSLSLSHTHTQGHTNAGGRARTHTLAENDEETCTFKGHVPLTETDLVAFNILQSGTGGSSPN